MRWLACSIHQHVVLYGQLDPIATLTGSIACNERPGKMLALLRLCQEETSDDTRVQLLTDFFAAGSIEAQRISLQRCRIGMSALQVDVAGGMLRRKRPPQTALL